MQKKKKGQPRRSAKDETETKQNGTKKKNKNGRKETKQMGEEHRGWVSANNARAVSVNQVSDDQKQSRAVQSRTNMCMCMGRTLLPKKRLSTIFFWFLFETIKKKEQSTKVDRYIWFSLSFPTLKTLFLNLCFLFVCLFGLV